MYIEPNGIQKFNKIMDLSIMASNEKRKKGYVQPLTELFPMKSSHLIMASFGGDAGGADDGGLVGGEEAKTFDLGEFQDRHGIPSDRLDNSLGK